MSSVLCDNVSNSSRIVINRKNFRSRSRICSGHDFGTFLPFKYHFEVSSLFEYKARIPDDRVLYYQRIQNLTLQSAFDPYL